MNHDQLVALLERERISYPDQLEGERYAPSALVRAHDPITEQQAEQHRLRLLKWPEKPEDES